MVVTRTVPALCLDMRRGRLIARARLHDRVGHRAHARNRQMQQQRATGQESKTNTGGNGHVTLYPGCAPEGPSGPSISMRRTG